MEKLTEQDRDNINKLCEIYDLAYSGGAIPERRRDVVEFDRDVDTLISAGFVFGFTGQSAWKEDRDGNLWAVTMVRQGRAANGGTFYRTAWYTVDKVTYLTTKQPLPSLQRFTELFSATNTR